MFEIGQVINNTYELQERIGSGGGGVIFKAYHRRMRKNVAIKLIKDNAKKMLKDRTEVDLLKDLKHPYLPQVLDFFESSNDVYTVMEFIDGQNFKQLISGGRKFDEKSVKKYAIQLCEAVQYLHSHTPPIIHSDIKPANIMLTPEDNICLIDFNISTITAESGEAYSVGGSKGFAAPEQFKKIIDVPVEIDEFHEETRFIDHDDETELLTEMLEQQSITNATMKTKNISMAYVDVRTDVYGIGASLYYILTGRIPQNGQLDFRGANISSHFKKIILKAINPLSEKRYKNVSEMLTAIKKIPNVGTVVVTAAVTAAAAVTVAICAAIFLTNPHESISSEIISETDSAALTAQEILSSETSEANAESEYANLIEILGYQYDVSTENFFISEKLYGKDLSPLTQFPNLKFIQTYGCVGTNISLFPELPELEGVNFGYSDIMSLEGIERFPNLRSLDVSGTYVSDLSYIAEMDSLESLNLYGLTFKDDSFIKIISQLKNLKYLNIGSVNYLNDKGEKVRITNIEDFDNLKNLEELDISFAEVSDISCLSELSKMKLLNLYYCRNIQDFSPIKNMTELENLEIYFFKTEDMSIFKNLTNIKILSVDVSYEDFVGGEMLYVYIDATELLKYISQMKSIEELNLNYLKFSEADIDAICGLESLKYLSVKSDLSSDDESKIASFLPNCDLHLLQESFKLTNEVNKVNEDYDEYDDEYVEPVIAAPPERLEYIKIRGVEYSIYETQLDLSNKGLADEDIKDLDKMTNLTTLLLSSNNISDISVLSGLTNLEVLNLAENNISDISSLKNLTKLRRLALAENDISDISALKGLTNLTFLNLGSDNPLNLHTNSISDISALSSLTKLKELYLGHNNISDISALKGLNNLTWLYLGHNDVSKSDIEELKKALPKCTVNY